MTPYEEDKMAPILSIDFADDADVLEDLVELYAFLTFWNEKVVMGLD